MGRKRPRAKTIFFLTSEQNETACRYAHCEVMNFTKIRIPLLDNCWLDPSAPGVQLPGARKNMFSNRQAPKCLRIDHMTLPGTAPWTARLWTGAPIAAGAGGHLDKN